MLETINLSGEWLCEISEENNGLPSDYKTTINLPDTLSNAKISPETDEICTGFLTDTRSFSGYAWFERELEISDRLEGKTAVLFLERTRVTEVFIDGKSVGSRFSLCTPHRYDLTSYLTKGKHRLTVRVDNVNYLTKGGHLTSPDTQTNWLGITGKIELIIHGESYVEFAMTEPDIESCSVTVHGKTNIPCEMKLRVLFEGNEISSKTLENSSCDFSTELSVPCENRLWDEDEQNLFTLEISCKDDIFTTVFAMRKISSRGRTLLINNHESFLRGKHDGMIFPKTGYAPTDFHSWLMVMATAKAHGINHYRFHTCCPPEAAFEAADSLGIYMQPEIAFWGTITSPDDENHNEAEQSFLREEGFSMLREFSNHPSFVMMSLGNELWGSGDELDRLLSDYKAFHPTALYSSGSNNFQFTPRTLPHDDFFSGVRCSRTRLFRGSYAMCDAPQGHIQLCEPNSSHNYDRIIADGSDETEQNGEIEIQYGTGVKKVKAEKTGGSFVPQIPVISHEVGQYEFFPDFDEEKLYTGSIKARYLEVFRERLEKSGLYEKRYDFFKSTGKLAVDCYKNEIETALRTKELSGFQLLDLQDFNGQGVALVGILNSFMKSKGLINADSWRRFCNKTVLLAQLPKFVFAAEEKPVLKLLLSSYGKDRIRKGTAVISYCSRRTEISFEASSEKRLSELAEIPLCFSEIKEPSAVTLDIEIKGTDISNSYKLWVYPESAVEITEKKIVFGSRKVYISRSPEEAMERLSKGVKTILFTEKTANATDNTYCTNFWNYPMFRSISESMGKPVPVGTMGMWTDKRHPALRGFAADDYTTPPWFHIIMHSHADILTGKDAQLIAQPIDNIERCHRLGLLYEIDTDEGKLLVCTSKIWEISDKPEVKAFARSIARYVIDS